MKASDLHDWPSSPAAAIAQQKSLADQIRLQPYSHACRTIAGADVSYNRFSSTFYAAFTVLDYSTLDVLEVSEAKMEVTFPYVPGLLSFREAPALLRAWAKLKVSPDVICFDGQGIAHPRRMGIASHMGLLLERPTIGCAKSILVGKYEPPPFDQGAWTPLIHKNTVIGAALRTKAKVQPVFVSPGHLMDLTSAVKIMLHCAAGYRIPEPTRQAHLAVNRFRLRYQNKGD